MDPELARIRRERYLAQVGKEESGGGGAVKGGEKSNDGVVDSKMFASKKMTGNDEDDVIDLLDSDEEEEVDFQIASKRPLERHEEVIDVDAEPDAKMAAFKMAAASRHVGEEDDDSVECLSGPVKAKPPKGLSPNQSDHICFLEESTNTMHDTHPQISEDVEWIRAHCPSRNSTSRTTPDVEGMTRSFQRMLSRENNVTNITGQQVLDLAIKHNVKCGKWVIFHKETPALLWQQIRDAVLNGDFGHSAKIKKVGDPASGLFIICIYTPDFTNKQDVLRVRRAMHTIMDNGKYSLSFKPDCYTYLGIYTKNQFKIQPTIYACGGKHDEECSTLFVNGKKCIHQHGCPRCFPRCKI